MRSGLVLEDGRWRRWILFLKWVDRTGTCLIQVNAITLFLHELYGAGQVRSQTVAKEKAYCMET